MKGGHPGLLYRGDVRCGTTGYSHTALCTYLVYSGTNTAIHISVRVAAVQTLTSEGPTNPMNITARVHSTLIAYFSAHTVTKCIRCLE